MTKRYIITLMAANRVGILAAVTDALAELGGNLHEVSQTVLQKFFTIILAVEFPEHRDPDVIVEHIRGVCRPFGVEVSLKDPTAETLQEKPEGGVERYFLSVTGEDRPGIIRRVSARLAQDRIDITDLYAVRDDREQSFVMVMELAVPTGVDTAVLQTEFVEIGNAFGLSATVQHESVFSAANDPRPVWAAARPHSADIANRNVTRE